MENIQQFASVRLMDCLDISMSEYGLFPVFDKNSEALCPEQFFLTNSGWNIYHAENTNTDIHLHMHDYVELLYFPDTDLEYLIESKIYRLNAGDILFIPKGFFHKPHNVPDDTVYSRVVLSMSSDYLQGINYQNLNLADCLKAIAAKQHLLLPAFSPENQFIRQILQQMVRVSISPFHGSEFLMDAFCAQIVLYAHHASLSTMLPDGRTTKNQLVRAALDFVSEHIQEQITLEAVAEKLFISKYHLSHAFKKHMGISLHQYIIMKRIEIAKTMILEGKPLNLVCLESGFNNYSNFFKAFRNIVGISPSEYAEGAENARVQDYGLPKNT